MLERLTEFAVAWGWPLAAVSLAMFLASLALVPLVVVRLPRDYLRSHRDAVAPQTGHPLLRGTLRIAKNLLGVVFLLGGVIMLVTPGQGVLSIVAGLMLLDFPGRRWLERRILGQPRVLSAVNSLRQRWGKPPLEVED
jgi:hypothetical protein